MTSSKDLETHPVSIPTTGPFLCSHWWPGHQLRPGPLSRAAGVKAPVLPQLFKQRRMDAGAQQRNWGEKKSDQPFREGSASTGNDGEATAMLRNSPQAPLASLLRMAPDHVVPPPDGPRANVRHTSKVNSKKILICFHSEDHLLRGCPCYVVLTKLLTSTSSLGHNYLLSARYVPGAHHLI